MVNIKNQIILLCKGGVNVNKLLIILVRIIKMTIFIFTLNIVIMPSIFAQKQEIVAVGSYIMADGETKRVATERAIHEAERNAVEKAGVYLESYSKINNLKLENDEIIYVAGRISRQLKEPSLNYEVIGDNSIQIQATIYVEVDTDFINEILKARKNTLIKENSKLNEAYQNTMNEMESIKKDIAQINDEKSRIKIRERIAANERDFITLQNIDKAKDMIRKRDYNNAIEKLQVITVSDKYQAEVYSLKGVALYGANQYEEAAHNFTKAIEKCNSDLNKAECYRNRGLTYKAQSRYEQAIEDFTKAIDLDARDAASYYYRADLYASIQEMYELALADCEKSLSISSEHDAYVYALRGMIYYHQGRTDDAVKNYHQSLQLDSNCFMAVWAMADYNFDNRNLDSALGYYNQLIEIAAPFIDDKAYIRRATIYKSKGNLLSAIKDYTSAIQLQGKNIVAAYNNRGNCYLEQKKYTIAIDDFNHAIAINPNSAESYYGRGVAEDRLKAYNKALADYTKAITLKPDFAYAYSNRGGVYFALGKYALAKRDCMLALQYDSEDEYALYILKKL